MERSYDDRDGFIWLDGKIIPWRKAQVHILTHALHYASSVFEGERAYNGKIFKSKNHSSRLIESGKMLDMPIPRLHLFGYHPFWIRNQYFRLLYFLNRLIYLLLDYIYDIQISLI